jgi:hypothetical protein
VIIQLGSRPSPGLDGAEYLPTNQGVLIGSYASVARMLNELETVAGVRGVMMTFDDFLIGIEQFGKALALGADAVSIGTAALIALGDNHPLLEAQQPA